MNQHNYPYSDAQGHHPDQDVFFMRQALALAESVLYVPSPNPRVGCVIVRDAQIIGKGATQLAGSHHAEVMALQDLADRGLDAHGATIYVTLEPCSHHGRTPPCVDALIAAKPDRVVFAHFDPNPRVAGQGMRALRAAGIAVSVGVCADSALEINPGFVSRMTRGLPYVWMKVAASLDGRTALSNGVSQWITGAQARADGHHWRARSCVVLTGIGTVRTDNPRLNVRHVPTPRQPKRAVIDPAFEIAEEAALIDGGEVYLFTATANQAKADRLSERNVRVIHVPEGDLTPMHPRPRVDMQAMMQWLAADGNNEVHVEAGEGLNGALLAADCIDELLVYMAPMLLGEGKSIAQVPALQQLDDAHRFSFIDVKLLGVDVRMRARVTEHWRALMKSIHLIS